MALAVAASGALSAPACGSSDTGKGGAGGGAGGSSGSATTPGSGGSGGQMPPKDSCGQPGDKGNNHGVGAYCTPGGRQCEDHPLAGLCLADVGQDQWFCSRIGCQKNSDCGNDATCVMQQGSSGCVPNRCLDGTTTSGTTGGSNPGGGGAGGSPGTGGSGGIITP